MLFVDFFVKLTWQISLIRTSDYIGLSGHKNQASCSICRIIKVTIKSLFV